MSTAVCCLKVKKPSAPALQRFPCKVVPDESLCGAQHRHQRAPWARMQTAVQFRYERLAPLLSEDVLPASGGGEAALAAAKVLTASAGLCSYTVYRTIYCVSLVQPG